MQKIVSTILCASILLATSFSQGAYNGNKGRLTIGGNSIDRKKSYVESGLKWTALGLGAITVALGTEATNFFAVNERPIKCFQQYIIPTSNTTNLLSCFNDKQSILDLTMFVSAAGCFARAAQQFSKACIKQHES